MNKFCKNENKTTGNESYIFAMPKIKYNFFLKGHLKRVDSVPI